MENLNYAIFEMAAQKCYSSLKYNSQASVWKNSQLSIIFANAPPHFFKRGTYGMDLRIFSEDRYDVWELEKDGNGVVHAWKSLVPRTYNEEILMYPEFRFKKCSQ